MPEQKKLAKVAQEDEMVIVNAVTLVALHLIVLIKRKYVPYISNVKADFLPLGLGKVLGNKGGISISMQLCGTRLLFVNSHLEAHW